MTFRLPGLCLTTRAVMVLAMLAVGLAVLLAGALPASAQGAEPQRVPDAPDKPTGKAIYAGMVDLEWNDLPEATSYDVQFYWDGAWNDLPGNGVDISFYGAGAILRNLPEQGVYHFQVRARNALGPSDWSEYLFMEATATQNWDDVPEPTNTPATGVPTISGKAEVSETLAASISDIEDENGLDRVKFSYQWTSGDGTADSDIEGATGATYTLRSDDAGKAIKVRVTFTDRGGYAESLTSKPVKVDGEAEAQADKEAPTVSSIAITSDPDENDADLGAYSTGRNSQSSNWASGVYRIGDDVQAMVTFNENVTVTGSPQLELFIGSGNRTAEYEGTDGSAAVFSYTVAEGDSDSDGIAIGANKLTLNSGSIKDAADNDANLSHNALTDQDDHKVDGIRPRIARFFLAPSIGGSDGAYSEGEEMIIVAEFTEDHPRGSVTGPPQVKLDFDGEERMARWDISLRFNAPLDYGMFGYVVQEGDLDSDGVAVSANSIDLNGGFIRDPAGNDAVLTHSAVAASSSFIVDAVAPTVSSIAITSDPGDDDTYGTGDKIEATVTFSENMTLPISPTCGADVVHCKVELELDIGGTARTADYQSLAGANVVFAYTVQAGDTDDNGISIGANKLTGQGIRDATGKYGYGINDADLSHDAVADDAGHKVSGAWSSLILSGDTTIRYAENGEGSVATYRLSGSDGTITWTLSDDDSDDFFLAGESATRRELSFTSSPNYEEPTDADTDNQYDVTIRTSDGANTSTLQVTVIVTNVRHDADELPIITGTARVGETLTVDTSPIPDTDQDTTFGYQWIRTDGDTDTNIDGATSSSYTLTANDEGNSIKVLVGFRTTGGELVRLTSAPTEITVSEPEPDLVVIGIDASDNIVTGGSFRVGVTVTNQGDAQSAATTLRWKQLVDGTTTEIGTVAQRALTRPQSSFKSIRLTAPSTPGTSAYWACVDSVAGESDATNNCSGRVTVTVTNNLATGAPTISGTAQVGETLRADTSQVEDADGLTNVSYSYQWLSSRDTEIQGATSSTYTLVPADAGKTIKVRVTFTDDAGHEETLISAPTAAVAATAQDNSEDEPSLRSYIIVVVTEDDSDPDNVVTSFTITYNDSDDCSASHNAYLDGVAGDPIHLGSATSESEQIASSLTNLQAELMGFDLDLYCGTIDSGRRVSRKWIPEYSRPGHAYLPVPGTYSTEPSLTALSVSSGTLTPAFHSHTFRYTVPDVANVDRRITLTTTAKDGYTVAFIRNLHSSWTFCGHSGLSCTTHYQDLAGNDLDPLTDTDTDTPGFQVDLDEGENTFAIHVQPPRGTGHDTYRLTITRAAPDSENAPATGAPTISGTVQVGETLTASTSGIADADGLSGATFSYQWLSSRDTEIQGATGSKYTLQPADAGKTIKVRVTFTDDANNEETLTSAATAPVAAAEPPASGPAVAIGLSPSGSVDEGTEIALIMSYSNLESDSDTSDTDYIFRADVVNADACEGGGMGGDRYMYKVDEDPETRTGAISASCAPGDYTVQVSISSPGNVELASATSDFTVAAPGQQQAPEPPPSTDATLSGLTLSGVDFGAFDPATTGYTASVANDGDETTVTPTTNDDGATYAIKLSGVAYADGTVSLTVGANVITIEVTAADGNTAKTYTVTITRAAPPSTDATLSGLALTGVDIGTFDSATTGYTASVANDVDETTVTPTTTDDGATYVVKLGGVTDDDSVIPLAVGKNVITIKVTAEDGQTSKTYTITVTRAAPPAPGPAVAVELSPSGSVDEGTEIALTMSFSNLESNSDTSDTDYIFRADVVDADACEGGGMGKDRYMYKVDEEPEVRTGTVSASCAPGDYTVQVSISSPGNVDLASATADFTVAAPGQQQQPEPPASTDATLSGLTLSGVDFGAFDPATTGYTASVSNDVDETTVTPTTNDDGATYVVKLDGVADDDGVISLSVGSNTITVEVTAEDGQAVKTYTVNVTRAGTTAPTDQSKPTAPTISSIAITSSPNDDAVIIVDGEREKVGDWRVYGIDDSIEVTVAFSAGVTVTGVPRLELDVGGSAKAAEYKSTHGNNLKFSYTVAENDEDTDGVSIRANKLTLNGGTILGAASQDADLSHATLAPQSKHKVDGIRPSFRSISFSGSNTHTLNGYYNEGEEVFIKVRFSEGRIYVSGTPQLTIDVGGKEKKAELERTGFGDYFFYTVQEGDLDLDGPSFSANSVSMNGGYIRDGAGNDIKLNHGGASAGLNSRIDAVVPTVSAVAITSDPGADDTYAAGDTVEVSVTFSEEVRVPDVTRSDLPGTRHPVLDLRIGNDTRSAKSGLQELGRDVKFTYTIQSGDTDTDGISINANGLRLNGGIIFDAAGNNPISARIHNFFDIPLEAVVPHDGLADDPGHKVAAGASTPNSPATGAPTISGTAQVGQTLTASTSGISDADGLTNVSYRYRWLGDGTKIEGARSSTYTLQSSDVGKVIKVRVTFTDDAGNKERLKSAGTAAVATRLSTDATLSGLSLSGVNIGAFDSATTGYTASVANDVTETTVTPTTNDDGATYKVKLDGVTYADGTVSLAVGSNVITVEVTAEDGNTAKTYTVTVTRAEPGEPPDTPERPSGEITSPGTVALDWNDVPTATSYDVRFWLVSVNGYVELSPDGPVHGISITFDGSGATVSGLATAKPGHDGWYAFAVRAVNDAGSSGWSGNNRIPVP